MDKKELIIAQNIIRDLDKVFSFNNNNCKINLKSQALWYNSEEIKGLVVKECNKYNNEKIC